MKFLSKRFKHGYSKSGTNLLELLLALSILTSALYPIVYLFKIAKPNQPKTQQEFLATLLAHHVVETMVAKKMMNAEYLPVMTESEPIVAEAVSGKSVSEYFNSFSPENDSVSEKSDKQIFWSLKPFSCQVDTYYLEGNLYKVIAYIGYTFEDKKMRVFLERLLAHPQPDFLSDGDGDGDDE